MVVYVLLLVIVAFAISLPATLVVRALSHRLNAHDSEAMPGQVKEARRRVPNTGGVAVYTAIAVPIVIGLLGAHLVGGAEGVLEHAQGVQKRTGLALHLLAALTLLHVLGVVDDRRPLGPWVKLAVMSIPAVSIPLLTDTRLLTLLDGYVGGPWASIAVTALWLLVVTNAMNFMDNMDGLAGGVGVVASGCFLAAALMQGQWFVAACLALLIGALLGFLVFNFPLRRPASIFMGDGGSLVVGFLLAFLTARTTYYDPGAGVAGGAVAATNWYGVFMPLIVLAVPLYDFASVVLIRLSQGKSPFVGDLQHLSHRLTRRGLSKGAAVTAICGFTAITGANGIFLGQVPGEAAAFAGVETLLVLAVIALIEYAATPRGAA